MLFLAAVVVVGLLGVVNLVLSFGVIRRLREHTETLGQLTANGAQSQTVMLAPGERIADFAALTVNGLPVSRDGLTDSTLVGFFSLDCHSCLERLPEFVEFAALHSGGDSGVLAVVVGKNDDAAAPIVDELTAVGRVIRERDDGSTQQAFGIRGFPAFALVDAGGVVRASGFQVAALSAVPA
jgi:hypothetical protein